MMNDERNDFETEEENISDVNFIAALDEAAANTRMKYIFCNVVFDIDNKANRNFIFRKDTNPKHSKTRILYIKDGVRVRFTDMDVLEMILEIEDRDVVKKIVDILKLLYSRNYNTTIMKMGDYEYTIPLLPEVTYEKTFSNRKDIEITFEDLYVLINLIVAKDIASTEVIERKDFLKRTLTKYILIIGRYYLGGEEEKAYFERFSIDYSGDIYVDFETGIYADENAKKIIDYKLFEKNYDL